MRALYGGPPSRIVCIAALALSALSYDCSPILRTHAQVGVLITPASAVSRHDRNGYLLYRTIHIFVKPLCARSRNKPHPAGSKTASNRSPDERPLGRDIRERATRMSLRSSGLRAAVPTPGLVTVRDESVPALRAGRAALHAGYDIRSPAPE